MTTMIEPDTRGIEGLSGKLDDTVTQLPAVIFEALYFEMADDLVIIDEPVDLSFDDEPWLKLPTLENLEKLWLESPLNTALHRLAVVAHGEGPDLMQYMAAQRQLANWEYELREARHAAETTTDDVGAAGAVGGGGSVASVDASGGGVDFSGGPEDGDAVGEGGQVAVGADVGGSPKVPRRRRSGKAARG